MEPTRPAILKARGSFVTLPDETKDGTRSGSDRHQRMKASVYIETTIVSYLVAEPTKDQTKRADAAGWCRRLFVRQKN